MQKVYQPSRRRYIINGTITGSVQCRGTSLGSRPDHYHLPITGTWYLVPGTKGYQCKGMVPGTW